MRRPQACMNPMRRISRMNRMNRMNRMQGVIASRRSSQKEAQT